MASPQPGCNAAPFRPLLQLSTPAHSLPTPAKSALAGAICHTQFPIIARRMAKRKVMFASDGSAAFAIFFTHMENIPLQMNWLTLREKIRAIMCLRSEEHTSELQSHSFISYA